MDKRCVESIDLDSYEKILRRVTNLTQSEVQRDLLEKSIEKLKIEDALSYLDSLQQNKHLVFCLKAQLYKQIQKYDLAYEMCLKAIEFKEDCLKCVKIFVSLKNLFTSQKYGRLNQLLQRFQKHQFNDIDLLNSLKKIKLRQENQAGFQEFFKDLQTGGALFQKIQLVQTKQDYRSVKAKVDIQKDETIVYIPKCKLILLQNARLSQIVKKVHSQKLYLRSPKHCQLSIFLLQQDQLGQRSDYFHYIRHFPKTFDTFPINFQKHELQHLKGSPFLEQVEQKIIDIQRDYDAICSVCLDFNRFKFQQFKNFRLLVSSRIFGIIMGKNRTDVLVPLADMLNHHLPKQTSWFYSDQCEGFIIKSLKKIAKSQQIHDSYGQKCNSRFFLNYGFTIANNQSNQVTIKIPFECEQDDKVEIYRQITIRISDDLQTKQFEELISTLRYSVIPHPSSNQDAPTDTIKETPFVNSDIQAKIWQKLQKIVESQISAYPNSLKQDKKLLLTKDLSINYYNCIVLRKGQKQILHFYLTMAKKMIKYFRSSVLPQNYDHLKQYQIYLKNIYLA